MFRFQSRVMICISRKLLGKRTLITNESLRSTTVDKDDVNFHGKLSNTWWNNGGEIHALHALNPLRIQFIRDGLANEGFVEKDPHFPLRGVKIIDVGCGGGILTEPLSRLGAEVTGIDASIDLITAAKEHAALDCGIHNRLSYHCCTVEDFVKENAETYDALVTSEVLEHVVQKDIFLKCCVALVKPGGSLFITTMNKTLLSWFGGIFVAERVLNLLPVGTHDWEKFISPVDVQQIVEANGCKTKLIHGMIYNPLQNEWSWSQCTAINYAIHVRRKKMQ